MSSLFICHASEDKVDIAKPLAELLGSRGHEVWYDDFSLTVGDSLAQEIDRGLARCTYGVVIVSPSFFAKHWTRRELDGLVAREAAERTKRILPVWHKVTESDVSAHSPTLAARIAARSAEGVEAVVQALGKAIAKGGTTEPRTSTGRHAGPQSLNIPPGYEARLNYHRWKTPQNRLHAETARLSASMIRTANSGALVIANGGSASARNIQVTIDGLPLAEQRLFRSPERPVSVIGPGASAEIGIITYDGMPELWHVLLEWAGDDGVGGRWESDLSFR